MTYTKQIEGENLKEGAMVAKKAQVEDGSPFGDALVSMSGKESTFIPFVKSVV